MYNTKNVKLERVQYQKSATRNECSTKQVQHEKSITHKKVQHKRGTTWKKCILKRVQYEKVQLGKSATRNEGNSKKVQHEVIATWSRMTEGAKWKEIEEWNIRNKYIKIVH